ncbi:YSIRK-type signal peptide-containing protein [Limosilactobacillus reuteri]|uniref:YSIRK-type signal peptide-containing protein n=1 Tax=Limosilactobacillus reuteri TaxID=1598 RepID=UPI0035D127FD
MLQPPSTDKQDSFTLRKLSIGVASVLLGSFLMGIQISQTAYASDETVIPVSQAPTSNSSESNNSNEL